VDPDDYSPVLLNVLWEKKPRRAFIKLAELFVDTADVERARIRSEWDFGREWSVPRIRVVDEDHVAFGPVEGVDADGHSSEQLLLAILVGLILRGPDDDMREDIAHIALVYHCALEAGVDPNLFFARVATVAGEPIGKYLNDFLRRPALDKSLWSMGYRKRRSGTDIIFEWFGNSPDYDTAAPERLDRYGAEIEI